MHYIFAAYLVELYFASQSYIYLSISYIAYGGYICLAVSGNPQCIKNRRRNRGSLSLLYIVNYAFLNSPHFAADGVIPTSILSESLLRKAGTGFSFTSKR